MEKNINRAHDFLFEVLTKIKNKEKREVINKYLDEDLSIQIKDLDLISFDKFEIRGCKIPKKGSYFDNCFIFDAIVDNYKSDFYVFLNKDLSFNLGLQCIVVESISYKDNKNSKYYKLTNGKINK